VNASDRLRRKAWQLRYRTAPQIASDWRRRSAEFLHGHARVEFQGPVRIGPGFSLDIPGPGTLVVGPGCDFRRGFVCEINGDGRVEIGPNSIFTSYALIQCTTSITIGARCIFGQDVMIADGNHRFRDHERHLLDQGYDYRPITIGDGAVVTSKCTIVNSIGKRALVGANSVVTREVPAYTLVAGVPAKVVEYFGPDDEPARLHGKG